MIVVQCAGAAAHLSLGFRAVDDALESVSRLTFSWGTVFSS